MAVEDLVEIKFRLADGSDIGPSKFIPSTTVGSLKEKIIALWPKDKENGPRTVNDLKLINAGRILENNKTIAESRLPVAEVPGGVITMHVVVRPPISDKNTGRNVWRTTTTSLSMCCGSLSGLQFSTLSWQFQEFLAFKAECNRQECCSTVDASG